MLATLNQHLGLEHYRFHVIEQWPDGPRKAAGLAAARSTFESLRHAASEDASFVCMACGRKDILWPREAGFAAENQASDEKPAGPQRSTQ